MLSQSNQSLRASDVPAVAENLFVGAPLARQQQDKLVRFHEALAAGQKRHGGLQDGALVDLRKLPVDVEVIILGDLHAKLGNLKRVLQHNDNANKLAAGKLILLQLGDLIHNDIHLGSNSNSRYSSVQLAHLQEMGASLETLDYFMELKTSFPQSVYSLLGNHDMVAAPCFKGSIDQSALFRSAILSRYGEECLKLYAAVPDHTPLAALGDSFAAVHAGPFPRTSIEDLCRIKLSDQSQSPILNRVLWSRLSGGEYGPRHVEACLTQAGIPNGTLFGGHTPYDPQAWCWRACRQQYILYAANDRLGYASHRGSELELVEVGPSARSSLPSKLMAKEARRIHYVSPISLELGGAAKALRTDNDRLVVVAGRDLGRFIGDKGSQKPNDNDFYILQPNDLAKGILFLPLKGEVSIGTYSPEFKFSRAVSGKHLFVSQPAAGVIEVIDRGSRFGTQIGEL